MADNGVKILEFDINKFVSLVDLQYAEYWTSTYGYDYSDPSNKKKQDALMELVWADINALKTAPHLLDNQGGLIKLPSSGQVFVLGTTGLVERGNHLITDEDREAFCAMRPYVCKSGTQRDEIIATLESGGSVHESANSESQSEQASTDEPVSTEAPEEQRTSTQMTPRETTPPQPEPPSSPSHKVNVKSRLAFRHAPSWVEVSENASEDVESKGELIKMLNNGTQYILFDEGVGYKCEWDYIGIGDVYGYIYNKFTEKLESTPVSLEIDCSKPLKVAGLPFKKEWAKQEVGKVYYEDLTGRYYVPIETRYDSTGGTELKQRMLEYLSDGLIAILKSHGKSTEDEEVERILAAYLGPTVDAYFVDPRPKSKMRVLVSFAGKYIKPLKAGSPEQEESEIGVVEEGSETIETITLNAVDFAEREKIAATIVVSATSNPNYEETIENTASIMELYALLMDSFEGAVEDIDLKKEAERFRKIPARIREFLSQNGIVKGDIDQIEFGLDSNNKIIYVSENSEGRYKKLTSGLESFADQTPMDSPRTMNYFYHMWQIEAAQKNGMPWTDFLGNYTIDPVPTVYPSKPREQAPNDIRNSSSDPNSSTTGTTTADKVDEKISGDKKGSASGATGIDAIDDAKDCWENKIKGAAADFDKKLKQSKSAIDNMKEKAMLASPDLRDKILSEANQAKDFVGDMVVADMSNTLDKIKDLDDVFEEVLNKISLGDILMAALSCLEMQTLSVDLDLDFPWPPKIPCFDLPKIPTIDFPDSLPTMDIMGDLSVKIFEAIIDALTQAFVEMIKDMIGELLDICGGEDDDLEGVDQQSNLNDLISDEASAKSPNSSAAEDRVDDAKLGVLQGIGALNGATPRTLSPAERAEALKNINDLLNEISLILSTRELCRLLKGRASQRTLSIVRSLVRRNHPHMYPYLSTKTKIENFFMYVGRLTGSKMCDLLAELPDPSRKPQLRRQGCVDPFDPDPSFEDYLREKGEATEEQIQEMLRNARNRRKEKMNKLAAIADLIARHQNGEPVFEDMIPDILCGQGGSTADGSPPLVDLSHDSKDFMEDLVIETMFGNLHTTFNRDIEGAINTMIRNEEQVVTIPVEVEMKAENGDKNKVTNPELQRLEAQGIDMDSLIDSARNGMVQTKQQMRVVSPVVRNLLREMEFNGSFYPRLDSEGVYYELKLPPDPESMSSFEKLNEGLTKMKGMMDSGTSSMDGFQDFDFSVDFDKIRAMMPDWRIRYKVPYQLTDVDIGQEVDDEYIVEIFSVDDLTNPDPENAREYLRTESEAEIAPSVKSYINALGMTTEATTPVSFTIAKNIIPMVYGSYEFNVDNPLATGDVSYSAVHVGSDADLGLEYYQTLKMVDANGDPCDDEDSATATGEVFEVLSSDISRLLIDPSISLGKDFLNKDDPCSIIKVIKTYYDKDNEKYSFIWEAVKDEYYQCMLEEGEDYDTFMAPPPQAVFGRFVSRLWTDEIKNNIDSAEFVSTKLDNFGEKTEKFFSTYVHPQAAKDLFSLIARQISNSQLFGSQTVKISVPGMSQASYNPYITKMQFVREATPLEDACDIDPHLLALKCFKEEAKKNIKDKSCPSEDLAKMKEDGSPRSELNSWETEMIHVLVKMTFRAYIIDYTLRGIFPISEFLVEETIDPYLLDFMMKKMLTEMEAYGGPYAEQFQEWSNKVYNKMVESDQIEPEAVMEVDPDDMPEHEYGDDASMEMLQNPNSMRALMRHYLMLVYIEIQDIIDRDLPGIRLGAKNPHEYLIEDWLPVIDLPESISPWSTRFSRLDPDLTTLAQVSTITAEAESNTTFESFIENGAINYSADFDELADAVVDGEVVQFVPKTNQTSAGILQALSKANQQTVEIDGTDVNVSEVLAEYEYKTINDLMSSDGTAQQGLDLLSSFTNNGEPFDLENGNFFLERFYKVATRPLHEIVNSIYSTPIVYQQQFGNSIEEVESTLGEYLAGQTSDPNAAEGSENFWGHVLPSNVADIPYGERIMSEVSDRNGWGLFAFHFTRIWNKYFSGESPGTELSVPSSYQEGNIEMPDSASASEAGVPYYVNVNVFNEIMPAFISELKDALSLGSSATGATWESGVLDLRDLEGLDFSASIWRANNFFEEISPGLRLIYIPPISDDQFREKNLFNLAGVSYGTTPPSNEQFYGQEESFADALATLGSPLRVGLRTQDDPISSALMKIRNRQKAFTIKEDLERERATLATTRVVVDGESQDQTGYVFTSDAFTREIYPIPLVDSTRLDGEGDLWWSEFSGTLFDLAGENFLLNQHNLNVELMKQDLLSSSEFNLLFDFVFPLNRYFSVLNVFTIMAMSAQPNRENAFDGTKDELWKLWKMLMSGGGYKQDTVSNEEMSQLMKAFGGGWSTPCFSFAFNLTPPKFKGLGLDIIPKVAIKTPPLIFKAVVEMIDPNIKISKLIIDLAAVIGLCIPIPAISIGLLPPTIFGFPPFGIGIGPLLTPLGFIYLALGFELNKFPNITDEEESSKDPNSEECKALDACKEKRLEAVKEKIKSQKGKL